MTIAEAFERISFCGDSVVPEGHDIRALAAEVVSQLPDDVQDWLLDETRHIFIAGSGQDGEFISLMIHPVETDDELVRVRIIFLSERLSGMAREEALWTIAHEIAHSRLNHHMLGGFEQEYDADALVKAWGFVEPPDRAAARERYRT